LSWNIVYDFSRGTAILVLQIFPMAKMQRHWSAALQAASRIIQELYMHVMQFACMVVCSTWHVNQFSTPLAWTLAECGKTIV